MGANSTSWKPGQSANPGGKPKDRHIVRDAARRYTEEAIEILAHLMRSAQLEASRISAANSLLDRGWGKPAQAIIGGDEDDPPIALTEIVIRAIDAAGDRTPPQSG